MIVWLGASYSKINYSGITYRTIYIEKTYLNHHNITGGISYLKYDNQITLLKKGQKETWKRDLGLFSKKKTKKRPQRKVSKMQVTFLQTPHEVANK